MLKRFSRSLLRASLWALIAVVLTCGVSTMAANPPLFIVVPLEWTLPIVPSVNVYIQNALYNSNDSAYNGKAPGGQSFIGLSRFAHVFSYGDHPTVGYFWEVLQPYANVQGPGFQVSGMGDPLLDLGWIQKWGGFQIEPQMLINVPIGGSQLTNHFWSFTPIFPFNWMLDNGKFALTGTFAYTWNTVRHETGAPDLKVGPAYFGSMIFTWMATPHVQPNIRYDYNHQSSTTIEQTGMDVPFSDNYEGAAGIGLRFTFPKFPIVNVWYEHGVSGKNTTKTKAVYLMLAYAF